MVNPPGSAKSFHWTKERTVHGESADQWLATASRVEGSWWHDWAKWAILHGGEMVPPYKLPAGEPAPGGYVRNESPAPFALKVEASK
jgi:polyhydroxyalkanoate synthase